TGRRHCCSTAVLQPPEQYTAWIYLISEDREGWANPTAEAGGLRPRISINYLPITAGSLYLGHDPEHAAAMHQSLVTRLGRQPQVWRDIHWAHQALSDPDAALAAFEAQW